MKIVVKNQIVDTDNISSVFEIKVDEMGRFAFDVLFFNDRVISVMIERITGQQRMEIRDKLIEKRKDDRNVGLAEVLYSELEKEALLENKAKLEKMRQDIIKIWSDNQTKIPVFKVENY